MRVGPRGEAVAARSLSAYRVRVMARMESQEQAHGKP
jgi:hypothetical protein